MSAIADTFAGMAKKKPTTKRGRPPTGGRTPAITIFARVSPELGKALNDYVDGIKPKTTLAAVVSLAVEEYLARVGHWNAVSGSS